MPTRMPANADVVVIGAGPAGSALSLRLARIGCQVVLLERTAFDEFRIGESIPPGAAARLQQLGVLDAVLETRPAPVYGVKSAWGGEELDSSSFLGNPLLNGWHVERQLFDSLLTSLAEEAGANVMRQTCARWVEPVEGGGWSVLVSSQEQGEQRIGCRFLVNAAGRSARLSRQMGVSRVRSDRLIGIAGVFENTPHFDAMASLIEAHALGWWYSGGLPDGRAIVIFFTDPDISARHGLARPAEWSRLLAESRHTFGRFSSRSTVVASLRVFPAASHHLERAAGDTWLAIGDALTGRDPLSSSGIDFALASAERASSLLCTLASGDSQSVDGFNREARADYFAYQRQQLAYYAMERRWPDSLFWRRRSANVARAGCASRFADATGAHPVS